MEYLRYVRILWKRYCKCKKITAPTYEIERLFFDTYGPAVYRWHSLFLIWHTL